ncbi:MAG TPA: alpha/beta family hydrolase [Flavitalea sp.]|nr:alpha/beta family hydrolase [Flavitalea sp.]
MVPQKANAIVTMAHGAGAGMNHPFMVSLAELLAEAGIASLRFNFPFMEKQQRRPDTPAVAHKTIESAIRKSEKLFPSLPLFVSGKSFGGRMSSQYLSENSDSPVKGIIFFGFPLHPPGKPSIDRAEHLKQVKFPMLFLQGTRDELAKLDLIEAVCKSLRTATLVKIEGANHAFKAGKQEILPILANTAHDWIMKQIQKKNKRGAGK